MNKKSEERIIVCNKIEDLPNLSNSESFERGIEYIIFFGEEIASQKIAIGEGWKEKTSAFVITIHAREPKIKIVKLITDKEIEDNQELFEKYARDYKELSTKLIYQLADKLNLKIEEPVMDFLGKLRKKKQVGKMGDWKYGIHGHHCRFENTKTEQIVETPFSFELEFGALDGYFFLRY